MQRRVRASLAVFRGGRTLGATRREAARAALSHLVFRDGGVRIDRDAFERAAAEFRRNR